MLRYHSGMQERDADVLLSVIIPCFNEARTIRDVLRLVREVDLDKEIVVVDDHSSDGTGDVARTAAAGDRRARIIVPPPLPAGWFGKSWACATGADATTA